MRGINDDEAVPLLRWCLDNGYQLRFIEQMPLDAQHGWKRTNMVTADEILGRLADAFSLTPVGAEERGSAPAEEWLVDGGPGRVGVIGSVSRPFCGACDRVRLTADGQIRNCLFAREETDLRAAAALGLRRQPDRRAAQGHAAREAGRSRHQRRRLPAADPPDVRDRRLTAPRRSRPGAPMHRDRPQIDHVWQANSRFSRPARLLKRRHAYQTWSTVAGRPEGLVDEGQPAVRR